MKDNTEFSDILAAVADMVGSCIGADCIFPVSGKYDFFPKNA